MPSRELSRLSRLKIDTLSEARLRTELNKSKRNFTEEIRARDEAAQQEKIRINTLSTALRNMENKSQTLSKENAELRQQIETLQKNTDGLREASASPAFNFDLNQLATARIEKLQDENLSLTTQLKSTRNLLDRLQSAQEKTTANMRTLSTDQIMRKFSEDITSASRDTESDFEIDDVEVDVRGALGEDDGSLVMGFDPSRQAEPEMSTRIKFNLKRRVQTRLLEND